jgi:molybdopterin/thiamine biosynthesis adenylyltransferase
MRYSRQIPVLGGEGQDRIRSSTVGIAGLGGLGVGAVTALASAGVGHLVLADGDVPSESGLNRQFIYSPGETRTKAEAAAEWAAGLNPDCEVSFHPEMVDDRNAEGIFAGCDVLVDCLDNLASRFCMNRLSLASGMPLVHGGAEGLFGQVTVVVPGRTPCLECILRSGGADRMIPSVGSAVSVISGIQATEVLKLVSGRGDTLAGRLLTADLGSNDYRVTSVRRDPLCPACRLL